MNRDKEPRKVDDEFEPIELGSVSRETKGDKPGYTEAIVYSQEFPE